MEGKIAKPIRVIFVEDDPVQLDVLTLSLSDAPDIEIVGAFPHPQEALNAMEGLSPDLMLTDIGMPGMSGIELIVLAKKKLPRLEIIALTVYDDIATVFEAIKAGATGYLLKSSSTVELLGAIREVRDGGAPITPKIARAMLLEFQTRDKGMDSFLTGREREILQKVEQGFGYKEIAETISLSVHTVHWHIKKIFEKLHAKNKKEALQKAREKGIL